MCAFFSKSNKSAPQSRHLSVNWPTCVAVPCDVRVTSKVAVDDDEDDDEDDTDAARRHDSQDQVLSHGRLQLLGTGKVLGI